MEIFRITKEHLDSSNNYIGPEIPYNCSVESEENLGTVKFLGSLCVTGYIRFGAGSGIEAGEGIKAGWGIVAGEGIISGKGITAGEGIKAGRGIEAGLQITCQTLNCKLRIFVGLAPWKIPTNEEKTLTCREYSGELAYGIFKKIEE